MSLILAIDQSTSATKAVLFNAAGKIVDKASREHQQIYPQPGWVEHDAEEIWQNVLAVIGEVVRRLPGRGDGLAGLAITNQRETVVAFDRRTGRPLHNAIVWQCRRGEEICRTLRDAGHESEVRNKTGLRLDAYFSASKLQWLIDERPDLARQLASDDALLGTIDTYLIYRLTEGSVFATDHTNASRTLLYDIRQLRWDEELCALFDVPMRALPEPRESFARFGETDATGILPKPLPICGIMGDSQASLFAQRCYEPGTSKVTFGSGTSVMMNVGHNCPAVGASVVTALAWVQAGRPIYALEGLINYSSATLSWLQNQLGLISNAAESEQLAETVENNGGVYLVPAFAGLSAPFWKPDARAAIIGMSAHTGKAHIVRAALESIAYQIHDVLMIMHSESGIFLRALYADGGPTRNKFLMQFTADITAVELEVAEVAESSALGVAMAGFLGLGIVGSLTDFVAMPRLTQTFRPLMNAQIAAQLIEGWEDAFRRVL